MKKNLLFLCCMLAGASPAAAGTYRVMFDMFSPSGIECEATPAPGTSVRMSRSVTDNPVIYLTGNPEKAVILCQMPDGTRWKATAQEHIPPGRWHTEGRIAVRQGARTGITILLDNRREDVITRSFQQIR